MEEQRQKGRHFGVRESLGKRRQLCFKNLGFVTIGNYSEARQLEEKGPLKEENGLEKEMRMFKRDTTFRAFY